MKRENWARIVVLAAALIPLCSLCGCSSNGKILSEANDDARLFMELSDYTGDFERTITIKNTQSGAFSVELSPSIGNIEVGITDGNGDTILSMNENATPTNGPMITEVAGGNGTYTITVQLKRYSGAFDISWDVSG